MKILQKYKIIIVLFTIILLSFLFLFKDIYRSLSYDHRIIDGRESVGFLVAIKEALENPIELLMNDNINSSLDL